MHLGRGRRLLWFLSVPVNIQHWSGRSGVRFGLFSAPVLPRGFVQTRVCANPRASAQSGLSLYLDSGHQVRSDLYSTFFWARTWITGLTTYCNPCLL